MISIKKGITEMSTFQSRINEFSQQLIEKNNLISSYVWPFIDLFYLQEEHQQEQELHGESNIYNIFFKLNFLGTKTIVLKPFSVREEKLERELHNFNFHLKEQSRVFQKPLFSALNKNLHFNLTIGQGINTYKSLKSWYFNRKIEDTYKKAIHNLSLNFNPKELNPGLPVGHIKNIQRNITHSKEDSRDSEITYPNPLVHLTYEDKNSDKNYASTFNASSINKYLNRINHLYRLKNESIFNAQALSKHTNETEYFYEFRNNREINNKNFNEPKNIRLFNNSNLNSYIHPINHLHELIPEIVFHNNSIHQYVEEPRVLYSLKNESTVNAENFIEKVVNRFYKHYIIQGQGYFAFFIKNKKDWLNIDKKHFDADRIIKKTIINLNKTSFKNFNGQYVYPNAINYLDYIHFINNIYNNQNLKNDYHKVTESQKYFLNLYDGKTLYNTDNIYEANYINYFIKNNLKHLNYTDANFKSDSIFNESAHRFYKTYLYTDKLINQIQQLMYKSLIRYVPSLKQTVDLKKENNKHYNKYFSDLNNYNYLEQLNNTTDIHQIQNINQSYYKDVHNKEYLAVQNRSNIINIRKLTAVKHSNQTSFLNQPIQSTNNETYNALNNQTSNRNNYSNYTNYDHYNNHFIDSNLIKKIYYNLSRNEKFIQFLRHTAPEYLNTIEIFNQYFRNTVSNISLKRTNQRQHIKKLKHLSNKEYIHEDVNHLNNLTNINNEGLNSHYTQQDHIIYLNSIRNENDIENIENKYYKIIKTKDDIRRFNNEEEKNIAKFIKQYFHYSNSIKNLNSVMFLNSLKTIGHVENNNFKEHIENIKNVNVLKHLKNIEFKNDTKPIGEVKYLPYAAQSMRLINNNSEVNMHNVHQRQVRQANMQQNLHAYDNEQTLEVRNTLNNDNKIEFGILKKAGTNLVFNQQKNITQGHLYQSMMNRIKTSDPNYFSQESSLKYYILHHSNKKSSLPIHQEKINAYDDRTEIIHRERRKEKEHTPATVETINKPVQANIELDHLNTEVNDAQIHLIMNKIYEKLEKKLKFERQRRGL
ncbi:hypothetical protein [Defluviitalea saccharophila]|uniref:Uncharacterized protein n=1 Tax=Defluviitalea saccharophila TaxID=879970 RepID=A0ABZ2Y8A5_9FIRM